jgi:plasmid stabilization system protein ParE
MHYHVILRVEARDDAIRVTDYILEHEGETKAIAWYEMLEVALESLSHMPHRCPLARENGIVPNRRIRQLVHQSYRIIFTVSESEVQVLHIRHVARAGLDDVT